MSAELPLEAEKQWTPEGIVAIWARLRLHGKYHEFLYWRRARDVKMKQAVYFCYCHETGHGSFHRKGFTTLEEFCAVLNTEQAVFVEPEEKE